MAMIFTTKGEMDESLLVKTVGGYETEHEIQSWQEYHLDGELVKRDVQLHLKQGLSGMPVAASF